MNKPEFICINETPEQTQKVIRQWISTGYTIDILQQSCCNNGYNVMVITSLTRIKHG